MITPSWLSGSVRSFLCSSSVYSCHLFLISFCSVRSMPFLFFLYFVDILSCPDSQITLTFFNICLISTSPTAWLYLDLSDLSSLNSLSIISVFLLLHTMVCEQCYHSLVHPYTFLCTLIAGSVGMCLLLFSCQVWSDSL